MRRLARISAYSFVSVLAVLLVLAVAAYVRLAQGPVSLDFLRGTVESKINQALPSMAVSIGGLVMERTGSAGVPHVRLTELRLNDKQGNYLASAPRASLGIDEQALFSGPGFRHVQQASCILDHSHPPAFAPARFSIDRQASSVGSPWACCCSACCLARWPRSSSLA